jgi:hypothetical protein
MVKRKPDSSWRHTVYRKPPIQIFTGVPHFIARNAQASQLSRQMSGRLKEKIKRAFHKTWPTLLVKKYRMHYARFKK